MQEVKPVVIILKEEYKHLYDGKTVYSGYIDEEIGDNLILTFTSNDKPFMSFKTEHIKEIL